MTELHVGARDFGGSRPGPVHAGAWFELGGHAEAEYAHAGACGLRLCRVGLRHLHVDPRKKHCLPVKEKSLFLAVDILNYSCLSATP